MKYLNFFTQDYKQQYTVKLDTGKTFIFKIEYSDQNLGWYFDIEYGDIKIYNIRLCTDNNILRKWKNQLSFGISCVSDDYTDPFFLTDLETGRIMLYLLSSDEVNSIDE
jgi:hypothetical protein